MEEYHDSKDKIMLHNYDRKILIVAFILYTHIGIAKSKTTEMIDDQR